jgi:hypothetical protein
MHGPNAQAVPSIFIRDIERVKPLSRNDAIKNAEDGRK